MTLAEALEAEIDRLSEGDGSTERTRIELELAERLRSLLAEHGAGPGSLDPEDFTILLTLLDREWRWDAVDPEKPSVITPEIRAHLDKIEELTKKVAGLRDASSCARSAEAAEQKEIAYQAFTAGAELFAGPDLEPPTAQFERFWGRQAILPDPPKGLNTSQAVVEGLARRLSDAVEPTPWSELAEGIKAAKKIEAAGIISHLAASIQEVEEIPADDVEQQKEMAYQAFAAGAELFAGPELEPPRTQFERFWERQRDHAVDAGLV